MIVKSTCLDVATSGDIVGKVPSIKVTSKRSDGNDKIGIFDFLFDVRMC